MIIFIKIWQQFSMLRSLGCGSSNPVWSQVSIFYYEFMAVAFINIHIEEVGSEVLVRIVIVSTNHGRKWKSIENRSKSMKIWLCGVHTEQKQNSIIRWKSKEFLRIPMILRLQFAICVLLLWLLDSHVFSRFVFI